MKVLVVDDDDEIRTTLLELLREEDCQVQGVSDGAAALQVLGAESGWIVFLDWMMPGLDGRGVIQALQANPLLCATNQFILMSATSRWRLEDAQLAAEIFVGFLPKPFELEDVLALLSHLDPASPPTAPPC